MDHDGLERISFRTIAMRLGVDPKALYTYVADKDDLLTGVFDAITQQLDWLPDDELAPLERLVEAFRALRQHFIAHAELFHLVRPTAIGADLSWTKAIWSALRSLFPDPDQAAEAYLDLVQITIGSALETIRERKLEPMRSSALQELDLDSQPELQAAAQAWLRLDREAAFERVLRKVLGPS
jgi:AcrR family transcriptional regulator